ncbi:hypothetical protein DICVIV_08322, partial [Dictyocaulus viviparus]
MNAFLMVTAKCEREFMELFHRGMRILLLTALTDDLMKRRHFYFTSSLKVSLQSLISKINLILLIKYSEA